MSMPTDFTTEASRRQQEEEKRRREKAEADRRERGAQRAERARMTNEKEREDSGRVVSATHGVPFKDIQKWIDRDKAGEKLQREKNLIKGKVVDRSLMPAIGHQVRGAVETIKDAPEIIGDAYEASYLKYGRVIASATQAMGHLDEQASGNLAAISRTMGDMERAQAPITNKGMEDDSFRWAFETTARAMPDLALGTLFTMAATPVGGAAYFGAMQAGDTYDQTLHSMLAKGHTMEEAKSAAAKAAAGAGTVTAGTSMVTGRAISGRVLPAGVQQKLGGSIAGRMMGSKAGQYGEAMVGEAVPWRQWVLRYVLPSNPSSTTRWQSPERELRLLVRRPNWPQLQRECRSCRLSVLNRTLPVRTSSRLGSVRTCGSTVSSGSRSPTCFIRTT
jgi:hypothetical protein